MHPVVYLTTTYPLLDELGNLSLKVGEATKDLRAEWTASASVTFLATSRNRTPQDSPETSHLWITSHLKLKQVNYKKGLCLCEKLGEGCDRYDS